MLETDYSKSEMQRIDESFMSDDLRVEYVETSRVMVLCQDDKRKSGGGGFIKDLTEKYPRACYVCVSGSSQNEDSRTTALYQDAKVACQTGKNVVIAWSNNMMFEDIRQLIHLAYGAGYVLLIVPPFATSDRRIGVEIPSIIKRANVPETFVYHVSFGWYLNLVDSWGLRKEAWACLYECWNKIPEFKETFSRICNNDEDVVSRYGLDSNSNFTRGDSRVHCDTKLCGYHTSAAYDYLGSTPAGNTYGSYDTLRISGFVISPNIVASILDVTYVQRELWDRVDEKTKRVPGIYDSIEYAEKMKARIHNSRSRKDSDEPDGVRTLRSSSYYRDNSEAPRKSIRRRRGTPHMVLGESNRASLYNLLYDVPEAIDEMEAQDGDKTRRPDFSRTWISGCVETYDLRIFDVRRFGKFWIITLKEPLEVEAIFTSSVIPCYPS